MLNSIFLVGIGGAFGSIARFLTGYYVNKFIVSPFPYGTFTANLLGCFVIGLVFGMVQRFEWFTPELRLLLATGFCGGYTTFSTFAYENLNLLQTQQYSTFALYTLISLSAGIIAVAAGLFLINKI
jgi:CrcB protein